MNSYPKLQNVEHSAVLLTCIKIPNGYQAFVLSIFEWPVKTGFTAFYSLMSFTGLRSAVGNMSGNRCESDCRSRGSEFDPGPVPYFCRE